MTTVLGASVSLMIRVGALSLAAFFVLMLLSLAATAQDIIAALPTTGPIPVPEVPTITLWRDGMIVVALVVIVAVVIWRSTLIERHVRNQAEFHGLAAAWLEDDLIKRGVVKAPAAPATDPTLGEDEAWIAEANKIAPPPPPAPRRVSPVSPSPTAKQRASTFSPRTRAKGNA